MASLLTLPEVAQRLRLPRSTLFQKLAELRALYPHAAWGRKIGRRRLFSEADLDRLETALCALDPTNPAPDEVQSGCSAEQCQTGLQ